MPNPLLIATWSFARRGLVEAWPGLAAGGLALDAVETVCRVAEDDPTVDSVGYGGLPDCDGHVTLDACVMLAPNRAGGVCAVRRHRHVTTLARRVMEATPHVLLAGEGADRFAEEQGLPEMPLLAPEAEKRWRNWKAAPVTVDQSKDRGLPCRPTDRGDGGPLFDEREGGHDTVGVIALDAGGQLAGACSTSGMPYKQPGRVGDSPIIGHGLYVDPVAGAVTVTGTGELAMGTCSAFLAVEEMRRGIAPIDAIACVLDRISAEFDLDPVDQMAVIAVRPDGRWATGALRPGFKACLATPEELVVIDPELVVVPD